jgi:hypothetical protein
MTMMHIDLLPRTSSLDPEHEPAAEIPSGMKMTIKSQQIIDSSWGGALNINNCLAQRYHESSLIPSTSRPLTSPATSLSCARCAPSSRTTPLIRGLSPWVRRNRATACISRCVHESLPSTERPLTIARPRGRSAVLLVTLPGEKKWGGAVGIDRERSDQARNWHGATSHESVEQQYSVYVGQLDNNSV